MRALSVGAGRVQVCYVKRLSSFLTPHNLYSKGSDASNLYDEELAPEEQVGATTTHPRQGG